MVTEFVLLDGLSLQVKLKKGEKSRKLQVKVLFVCFFWTVVVPSLSRHIP